MPTRDETLLATQELATLTHATLQTQQGKLSNALLSTELKARKARVTKLESLTKRCLTKKVEDRLTRPDRTKKIRVSTCEVVDLALKTAYDDLQRLGDVSGNPIEPRTTALKTH